MKAQPKPLRQFLVVTTLLLATLNGCTWGTKQKANKRQPNIVLILVDDLGWRDLSSYGSTLYRTPNTDSLAFSGVRFTDAYAACTVCSPTRASIMTGKYPARINCTDWISGHKRPYAKLSVPDWTQHIQHEDQTLAEVLSQNGYSTAHIGKWHLGEDEQYWPENQGFDLNIGGWKKGQPNAFKRDKPFSSGYFSPYMNPRLEDGNSGEYLTERLANEAADYIQKNKHQPFFLNFWLYNVHTPLQARQQKVLKYDSIVEPESLQSNSTYAAMIEHMDEAVGTIMSVIKDAGLYDNTIIIFTSDNGGLIGNRGKTQLPPRVTSNNPLRTGKGDIYEGGVRVPLIISWPGRIARQQVSDVMSISPDIYTTVLGLLEFNDQNDQDLDGLDLSEYLLNGERPDRSSIFWHYPHYHTEGASPYSAVRSGQWKLIQQYQDSTYELYDLTADISETNNLVDSIPNKADELKVMLEDWKREVGAQLPGINANYNPVKSDQWKTN